MSKKVGVSESLSPVKKLLYNEGFEVINFESDARLSEVGAGDYDAIIVSGMDVDMMGMQDISSKAPVINAAGKSPEEILRELNTRL